MITSTTFIQYYFQCKHTYRPCLQKNLFLHCRPFLNSATMIEKEEKKKNPKDYCLDHIKVAVQTKLFSCMYTEKSQQIEKCSLCHTRTFMNTKLKKWNRLIGPTLSTGSTFH